MQAILSHPGADHVPAEHAVKTGPAKSAEALPQESSLESSQLLRGKKSVSIVHNGALYRLQSTKLGKLILTK